MTTTQLVKDNGKCDGCNDYDNDEKHPLTKRTWTHYDHDSGWAYEDGERVRGAYCPDCLADIDRITEAQADYEDSLTEPTIENWAELACRMAQALSMHFSNWHEVAHVTRREMDMLTEQMGEGWQRKW